MRANPGTHGTLVPSVLLVSPEFQWLSNGKAAWLLFKQVPGTLLGDELLPEH